MIDRWMKYIFLKITASKISDHLLGNLKDTAIKFNFLKKSSPPVFYSVIQPPIKSKGLTL